MKDEALLSKEEREAEREKEKDQSREGVGGRRSSARAAVRVRGMARMKGVKIGKSGPGKSRSGSGKQQFARAAPPRGAPLREFTRRATVKTAFSTAKSAGQWAAHARYLEREGAQVEGQNGVGFSATGDAVSIAEEAYRWQQEGDSKVYKIVLSPEDGTKLDMREYTRAVMSDIQRQTGQPLQWVAIDHHNTGHPHAHILLRGRGLELSPDLVKTGMRAIAEDRATQTLGYKSEREKIGELNHDIAANRFTQLDRLIKSRVHDGIVTEAGVDRLNPTAHSVKDAEIRAKRIQRLQHLEALGVATKTGAATWKLDDNWESALRQMEVLRTRSKMLQQHRELLTDPRALPVVTKLKDGEVLLARSLGGGLDDKDKPYLLVEGADGRAHFISRSESSKAVKPGQLILLSGYETESGHVAVRVKEYDLMIPSRGFAAAMKDSQELQRALTDRSAAERGEKKDVPAAEAAQRAAAPRLAGFAGQVDSAMALRKHLAEEERKKKKGIE